MAEAEEPDRETVSFGEELKREREIRGISLIEIADATKISKRFLEALEKNDFAILPAPVFTRGFVREYARYLGLNPEEMLNRYGLFASTHRSGDEPQPLVSSTFSGSSRVRQRSSSWIWILLGALVLVAIASAVVVYRERRAQRNESPRQVGENVRPESQMVVVRENSVPAQTPAAADRMELELTAAGDTWVELSADGVRVLRGEMAQGDVQRFTARERFEFQTIGNARGLNLKLNGVPLPSLGNDGEVVHGKVYDRAALQNIGTASSQ